MKSENIFLAMNGVDEKLIADCDTFYENSKVTKIHKSKFYLISSIAAILALSVFSLVCISHPAFAKDIPLVGNIFSQLGYKLGFGGGRDVRASAALRPAPKGLRPSGLPTSIPACRR